MRQSKVLSQFLNAVNIAAVAIMVSVLFEIGRESLVDWRAIVIAAVSFAVTFGLKKVSVMWVVLGGAILGYLLHLI